jgi:hypothetical protein
MQIRDLDFIPVHYAKFADASAGYICCGGTTESTCADDEDF